MAVRKSVHEDFVVDGSRGEWFALRGDTLELAGFRNLDSSSRLFQRVGTYRRFPPTASSALGFTPWGTRQCRIAVTATANVDNLYALFKSPGRAIIEKFKQALSAIDSAAGR